MTLNDIIVDLRKQADAAAREERFAQSKWSAYDRLLNRVFRKRPMLRKAAAAYHERQALIVASNKILRLARFDALYLQGVTKGSSVERVSFVDEDKTPVVDAKKRFLG